MKNRDMVLEFARASEVATVSGVAIEVKPPETEEEYKRNHNFWLEVFKCIDELKVDGLPSVSCNFFFQTPDEPIPLTRFEGLRKKLGLRVGQKKKPGEVKGAEARHISFAFLDREAMQDGWVTLCLDKTQHERLRSPGLNFRVILLPDYPPAQVVSSGRPASSPCARLEEAHFSLYPSTTCLVANANGRSSLFCV